MVGPFDNVSQSNSEISVLCLKKNLVGSPVWFYLILPPMGLGRVIASNSRTAWATGVRPCIRTTKTNLDLVLNEHFRNLHIW